MSEDISEENYKRIEVSLKRMKISLEFIEEKQKIGIERFKNEVLNNPNSCIKLIREYLSDIHRNGRNESFETIVSYLMNNSEIVDLYVKGLTHLSWTNVPPPLKSKSGEIDDLSPAWLSRVRDFYIIFQNKDFKGTKNLKDFLRDNLGERKDVINYKEKDFIKFCELCGLNVDFEQEGWPTKPSDEMIRIKDKFPNEWTQNIRLIPVCALLANSMKIDVTDHLTTSFSIIIAWIFFVYFMSIHSDKSKEISNILTSTETCYDNDEIEKETEYDHLIDIVAEFGRIVSIIIYGTDKGNYPNEHQIHYTRLYRSKIKRIFYKLANELFNITTNGIDIKIRHLVVITINNIRLRIQT